MKKILFLFAVLFWTISVQSQTLLRLGQIDTIWNTRNVPLGLNNTNTWYTLYNHSPLTPVAPLSISTNTISISQSNTSTNGYLSSTDWNTFNNKGSGSVTSIATGYGLTGGTITTTGTLKVDTTSGSSGGSRLATQYYVASSSPTLTFTSPLTKTTNTVTISQSSGSTNGYLSSTDWTTFNSKQDALTATSPLSISTNTISISASPTFTTSVTTPTINGGISTFTTSVTTPTINGGVSTFTTSVTTPIIYGGTGVGSNLIWQPTTGVGTSTSAGITAKVGNNGATTSQIWLNDGTIQLGGATSTGRGLDIKQGTATFGIGNLTTSSSTAALYLNQSSPSGTNYALGGTSGATTINSTADLRMSINDTYIARCTSGNFTINDAVKFNLGGGNPTGNIMLFGSATTSDLTANILIATGNTAAKGLVIQGKSAQTASEFEIQASTGNKSFAFNSGLGTLTFGNLTPSSTNYAIKSTGTDLQLNAPTGNGVSLTVNNVDKFSVTATTATMATLVTQFTAFGLTVGRFGTLTTNDATADFSFGGSATTKKVMVLQPLASQSANIFETQISTGAVRFAINNLGVPVLPAGTATASTAPLKFTSGTSLTSPEAGAMEFTTDNYFLTGTTGTTRKTISDFSYRAITGARTLDGSDELIDCTSGTFAVTLPTAVGFTKQYTIKNSGTGFITLNTTSSQTIDGSASGAIVFGQYHGYILRSNGTNWIVTGVF